MGGWLAGELPEHASEDDVAHRCLRERTSIGQEWRHTVFATRRVVAVDEVAERIQAGVLRERHCECEAAGLDRNPTAHGVKNQAKDCAVQRVHGEAHGTPARPARHPLAEQRDVRVVTTEDTLVDRLEQSPDRRRGRAGCGGPELWLCAHAG